jgi:hypothetical protein
VLVAGQRPRQVPVEVERPQVHRSYPQREPEDCPHPRLQHRRGEGRPPACHRIGQVGLSHHLVLLVRIHARPLAEGVLQVLDQLAHLVAAAQRPARDVTRHEHHSGASDPDDPRAHRAQPG